MSFLWRDIAPLVMPAKPARLDSRPLNKPLNTDRETEDPVDALLETARRINRGRDPSRSPASPAPTRKKPRLNS